jgi:hypothetical protein
VFAHAEAPLIGLGLAFLGVHYLAESIGVWWAYAAGLAITVGWSGVLWLARRWLPRRFRGGRRVGKACPRLDRGSRSHRAHHEHPSGRFCPPY